MTAFYVGLFGLCGVFSRYGVDALASRWTTRVPMGTGLINLVGSFLAGILYAYGVEKRLLSAELRIGLQIGLLGGFTTFSSYSIQSALLFENGLSMSGLAYWALSPMLGVGAAFAGLWVARSALG